jgi:single-strand DNA-binding protein
MNYNKAIVCGRLGQDPEMRYTPAGTAVVNFSIAVSRYTKKSDGEGFDTHTTWIDVTAWGNVAEKVAEIAKKGTEVIVDGALETRSWEDKNHEGVKHYRTFINASIVQIGYGKKQEGEASSAPPVENAGAAPTAPDAPPQEEEDDLPF